MHRLSSRLMVIATVLCAIAVGSRLDAQSATTRPFNPPADQRWPKMNHDGSIDDGTKTRFLDIGSAFLEADGSIAKDVMADGLHPTVKGYQLWANAMQPTLDELMK